MHSQHLMKQSSLQRPAPLGMLCGEALGKAVLHRLHQGLPREGVSPQADGLCFWDELGGQKLRTASDQPMLQVTQDTHKWLSYWPWPGRASEYDGMHSETTRHLQTKGAIKLVPTMYSHPRRLRPGWHTKQQHFAQGPHVIG